MFFFWTLNSDQQGEMIEIKATFKKHFLLFVFFFDKWKGEKYE